jgi:uncharacterized protein with FMN-binding domain
MRSTMRALAFAGSALAVAAILTGCPAAGVLPRSSYLSGIDTTAPSLASVPDGTYSAKASVPVPLGSFAAMPRAEAEVVVAGHAFVSVKMTAPREFPGGVQGFDEMGARVVAAQSTDVDIVSGATFTGKAFLLAAAKAVSR